MLRTQLERYQDFLRQDPTNPQLISQVAELYLRLGEIDDAQHLLSEALGKQPKDIGLRFQLATVALARKDTDRAIELLSDLIREGIDNPALRYNLAYGFVLAGRYTEAKENLQPIVVSSESPKAPVLLARVLHQIGELDEGIKLISNYIERNPNDSEAQGILALLYLDNEDTEHAKQAAQKAIETNPEDAYARIVLGAAALDQEDANEAKAQYRRALDRNPASGRAWSGLGLADMLRMDLPQAIDHLKQAVDYMPKHLGTWHALAWCQIAMNDLVSAEATLNKAIEIDRTFSENHGGLAVVAILKGQRDGVREMIKRAFKLDPMSFSGRFAQSLLMNESKPSQAQALIRQILAFRTGGGEETLRDAVLRQAKRQSAKNQRQ